ncbi:hypothetical protein HK103_007480 [Boothiomyces macroporosus]|uniref:Methyltransferase type 11 domain-containing protein n=1 Tax=Boothiomyces macroporosus TaxID=261099 RepID=A0AAD5Y5Y5_9FUNG|nr:hypothetical protein HK103_007480 [Boothiomyces macroporosus]
MGWSVQESNEFYQTYADLYDQETSKETYPAPHIISLWVHEYTQNAKLATPKILDVGCGTGQSSQIFFSEKNSYQVTGIDASPQMLGVAKKYPFFKLICQDIQLPFDLDTFDAILCVGVLDFVADIEQMLARFKAHLQPQRCIGITIPATENESLNFMTSLQIEEMLSRLDLKVIKQEKFLGYQDSETGLETLYWGLLLTQI